MLKENECSDYFDTLLPFKILFKISSWFVVLTIFLFLQMFESLLSFVYFPFQILEKDEVDQFISQVFGILFGPLQPWHPLHDCWYFLRHIWLFFFFIVTEALRYWLKQQKWVMRMHNMNLVVVWELRLNS